MQVFQVIYRKRHAGLSLAIAGAFIASPVLAEPIDALAAFRDADANTEFAQVDTPRRWYREHFSSLQRSTPIVGCAAGTTLAAGGTWLQKAGGCVAGGFALSTIAPMIDPLRTAVKADADPLNDLFNSLPRRDATAATSTLAASLDHIGRQSRTIQSQSDESYRKTEIAERKQRNSGIWGEILLGAAQGYLAYETAKAQTRSSLSVPSLAGGSSSGNSVTIYRRDANGRSQGQYEAPLVERGGQSADSSGPQNRESGRVYVEAASGCISIATQRNDKTVPSMVWFRFRNSCGFSVKAWHNRLKNGNFSELTILRPGETPKSESWEDPTNHGRDKIYYIGCPETSETGASVHKETTENGFSCYYWK